MPERTFPAHDSALQDVLAFTEEQLEAAGCPMKKVMQITVAIEEMFVNIAHYAYPGGNGTVRYSIEHDDHCIIFRLADSGIPFDPLAKPDPDVTLSAEERKIGGLGIYMMKQTMDDVTYEYTNGENILTMKKII
ncbi:MAG: ATP-binding protein [Oscillospiraceae bacterium]